MRQIILSFIFTTALLICGVNEVSAQERPKLREISDKKFEHALQGVVPTQKKEECGYADPKGKFVIPAIFHKVMPMSDKHVGFVCFLDEFGSEYWTPISLKGLYLTDLNFSKVVKDFDDRGLAVVRQEDKYGIINHTGKMVAGCNYQHFEDKTPVYILNTNGGGCIAVAKDKSDKGYTSYSFAAQEPIIVKAEEGYGIISPKNYFVVADFVYDSVKELVTWEAYCLQKGQKKYLYAADKLSMGYEEVISIQGGSYFVVKYNGKYGILTSGNEILLSCCQDEIPVLKKNEYTCLYENGSPVYLTIGKRISTSEYDDYLYNVKFKGAAVEYLLEETLAFENKKYVVPSLAACYGTKNFDLLSHLEVAKEYAENRKFILLSRDNENARFYDLESKSYVDYPEVLYHAFPSKSGAPAYASVLRSGKFGIIDVRNGSSLLTAEYDKITPIGNGYVSLQKADSLYLYNVNEKLMITSQSCEAIEENLMNLGLLVVKQGGNEKLYSISEHRWTLPDNHTTICLVYLPTAGDMPRRYAALAHKGAKGALFDAVTGEQLTDYLFDGVDEELFGGKYHIVTVADKRGVYDVEAKKYILPCEWAKIHGYYQFNNCEFAIVTKADRQGIYNLTTKKLIVTPLNDKIDMKGGYARIRREKKYGVYSLRYNKMVLDSPVDEVELLEDGYALLQGEKQERWGVYNFNQNEWQIDPVYEYIDNLGGDYVSVYEQGLINYKTSEMVYFVGDNYCVNEVVGDFVVVGDVIDGVGGTIYRIGQDQESDGGMWGIGIDVLTSHNTSLLGRNFGVAAEYEREGLEVDCDVIWSFEVKDLDSGRVILSDSLNGDQYRWASYLDSGLLNVETKSGKVWLFDLYTERWILSSNSKIKSHTMDEGCLIIAFENGLKYIYDPSDKVISQMKDTYDLKDYLRYKEAKSLLPASATNGYDRVSMMFKQ